MGKKRYQNDTRTRPQNTIWEPWAGGHPSTHTLEQNIDTLSALAQRIPTPYFMSGSNSVKRGKEPNKRTKQSNKFSISPWQCSCPDADTMDWSDPSDMLKQYKLCFDWEGPCARTHTQHKQTQSFFLITVWIATVENGVLYDLDWFTCHHDSWNTVNLLRRCKNGIGKTWSKQDKDEMRRRVAGVRLSVGLRYGK